MKSSRKSNFFWTKKETRIRMETFTRKVTLEWGDEDTGNEGSITIHSGTIVVTSTRMHILAIHTESQGTSPTGSISMKIGDGPPVQHFSFTATPTPLTSTIENSVGYWQSIAGSTQMESMEYRIRNGLDEVFEDLDDSVEWKATISTGTREYQVESGQSVPEIVVSSASFDLSVTDFSDSTTIYVDGRQYMGTMEHMTGSFRIDARAENGATLHRFVDIDFAVPNESMHDGSTQTLRPWSGETSVPSSVHQAFVVPHEVTSVELLKNLSLGPGNNEISSFTLPESSSDTVLVYAFSPSGSRYVFDGHTNDEGMTILSNMKPRRDYLQGSFYLFATNSVSDLVDWEDGRLVRYRPATVGDSFQDAEPDLENPPLLWHQSDALTTATLNGPIQGPSFGSIPPHTVFLPDSAEVLLKKYYRNVPTMSREGRVMATVAAKLPGSRSITIDYQQRVSMTSEQAKVEYENFTGEEPPDYMDFPTKYEWLWCVFDGDTCGTDPPPLRTVTQISIRHAPVSKLSTLCIGDPAAAENAFRTPSVVIQELSVGSTVMDFDEIQLGEGMSLPSEGLVQIGKETIRYTGYSSQSKRLSITQRGIEGTPVPEVHPPGLRPSSWSSPFGLKLAFLRTLFSIWMQSGGRSGKRLRSIWQTCDGRAPTLQVR